MASVTRSAEKVAWSAVGLAFLLLVLFFGLSLLSKAPVVGGAAAWTGAHASGAAYGF